MNRKWRHRDHGNWDGLRSGVQEVKRRCLVSRLEGDAMGNGRFT